MVWTESVRSTAYQLAKTQIRIALKAIVVVSRVTP
jgi:hypothetical protein